jgi:hypothetical protein
MKIYLFFAGFLLLAFPSFSQTTIYVNPGISHDQTASGTVSEPYGDISTAVQDVFLGGGGEVLILEGTYELTSPVSITTGAGENSSVIIQPVAGGYVKFNFGIRSAFIFRENASYITLKGIEIDGNTDETDFWCVVADDLWSNDGNPDGGGLAIILDGQYITIEENYIHDCYQKAVEIRNGRYVVVSGNIVQSIGNTSLSGGHGIMRQQTGDEFLDDDVAGVYRWDIRENLIFNVEQRIYSWVPRKGFMKMVIDEGKSILIDDPKDSNGIQERMTARIRNNIVAYGAIDHIRLKSTPNLEVSNNTIFSERPAGEGITDKGGDTDTPQFTNFICRNNAAQTVAGISAIEIDKAVQETNDAGGTPDVMNNFAMNGRVRPTGQSGITPLINGNLFENPNGGNFRINPNLNLTGVGVEPTVITELESRADNFGSVIGWNGWITDNLKLTQTILDNIPGINDGTPNNETVFSDQGSMNAAHDKIIYSVVDGVWKAARNSPSMQEFELNPVYVDWYNSIVTNHFNANGGEYQRIRYGDSYLKQDQLFDEDWLTFSEITATSNTLIDGNQNNFTLDGDILISFDNFTPALGATFDLISARTITSSNSGDLFDRVLFRGFIPEDYTLQIVPTQQGQVVRLTIQEPLPVDLLYFRGRTLSKGKHLLTWETSSEQDNDFFEVQRTVDGVNWQVLGEVEGATNAVAGGVYRYADEAPIEGINLYRLRQVDLDGTFEYSSIVNLNNINIREQGVAYPNPFVDRFVIPFSGILKQFNVYTTDGRDITGTVKYIPEDGNIIVWGGDLVAGAYWVRYNQERAVIVKK